MPSEIVKTWESTSVMGLVRHLPSGMYYHRFSVSGKRTYHSLKTRRYPTAKLKLAKSQESAQLARLATNQTGNEEDFKTLGDFTRLFFSRLTKSELNARTMKNWEFRKRRLTAVWPEWESCLPARLTEEKILQVRSDLRGHARSIRKGCKQALHNGYSPACVNQTLWVLKNAMALARRKHVIFSDPFDNPGLFLSVPSKRLVLPSRADLDRILTTLGVPSDEAARTNQSRYSTIAKNVATMGRFLAYSGMRHNEATAANWEDWNEAKGVFRIRGTKTKNSFREIPLIPAFKALLVAMRAESGECVGPILKVKTINPSLERACKKLGLPKMSMHTLRHYFATVCIEAGVDIPTVSRWLGHADGGALAMRTYGHLRDEHSQSSALRVNFGLAAPAAQSIPNPTFTAPLSG